MSEHTPMPWRVYKNTDGTKLVGIGDADGIGILDAGFGVWAWNDPEGIANAEKVVRAVNAHDDLVRAVDELLEIEDARMAIGVFISNAAAQDRIDRARAALAKAKAL
jgi:hypothetical protein